MSLWAAEHSTGDVWFRRTWDLPAAPVTATLGLSSGSAPELVVNGLRVPGVVVSPSRYTRQYDIAPWLQSGRNEILLRDPADGRRSQSFGAVILAAFADGTLHRLRSDRDWDAGHGPDPAWTPACVRGPLTEVTSHLCYWPEPVPRADWLRQIPVAAEDIRAIADTTRSSVSHWPLIAGTGAAFSADPERWPAWQRTLGTPMRDRLNGLESISPGVLVDFGRCLNGRVRIDGDPDAPAIAVVSLGESAAEALSGPDIPLQTLCLPAGGSAETCESGFRFARIHFLPMPGNRTVRPQRIRAQYVFCPLTYRGQFRCPDETLNAIWNLGAYTVRQNIQDEVWDANKRDRHPFTGDLVPQEAVARVVFDDPRVIRHTLSVLAAQAGLPGTARNHINGIPTYSALWVDNLYRDFRQTGDLAFVRAQKPAMLGLLGRLEQDLDPAGAFRNTLGGWPFVDWSPGLWHRPGIAPITEAQLATAHAMMYGAVTAAAEMLEALGDSGSLREADRLSALGRKMKAAAFSVFWNPGTETFGSRKHPNAAAVHFGLTDEAQARRIEQEVLSRPFHGEAFPDSLHRDRSAPDRMSPYFVFYLLEARTRAGSHAAVLEFIRTYWGEMIRRGATTTWELFQPGDQPGPDIPGYGPDWDVATPAESHGMSLMHGWSAGATYWLSRHVLGVRETSPGYATAEIRPFLGGLPWAEGTVPTPRGDLVVRHEHSEGRFLTSVNAPARIAVRAGIPKAPGQWMFTCAESRIAPADEDDGWWCFAIPPGAKTVITAVRKS